MGQVLFVIGFEFGFDVIFRQGCSVGKTRGTQSTRGARGAGSEYIPVRSAASSVRQTVLPTEHPYLSVWKFAQVINP